MPKQSYYYAQKESVIIGLIERFSIECRKTKTKVITLTNHKEHRQSSELQVLNYM